MKKYFCFGYFVTGPKLKVVTACFFTRCIVSYLLTRELTPKPLMTISSGLLFLRQGISATLLADGVSWVKKMTGAQGCDE